MPNILIFSISYLKGYIGGAELAVKEITDRNHDFEFDLITVRFNSKLTKTEKLGNVTVYRTGIVFTSLESTKLQIIIEKFNKYAFPVSALVVAFKLHRKRRYAIIWSIMATFAGFAAMFFKSIHPETKFLLTLQEGDPLEQLKHKARFFPGLFKKIFTQSDHVQSISGFLKEYAFSMGYQGEVSVIPNGVDFELFSKEIPEKELETLSASLRKGDGEIFIITTSRLVRKNAIEDVIRAMKLLPDHFRFLVLGTGPDSDSTKSLAIELGVQGRVDFIGHVDYENIPKYLKISEVFIRPSLSEGLGNSFLEAMAARIPVIATEVGGIPDFLYDPDRNPDREPTGIFCKIGDPADIAEKVKYITGNQELKDRITENAFKLVGSQYTWDSVSRKINEVFRSLSD